MRAFAVLLAVALAAGCGKPAEEASRTAPETTPEPVAGEIVVFVAEDTPAGFDRRAGRYTDDTGVRVTVRRKPPAEVADDVIADRGKPPADVVIAPDVAGAWRAADAGALRPLSAETVALVPAHLRDPDNYWAAVDVELAAVVYDPEQMDTTAPRDYEDLAGSRFSGDLCLSSSANPTNRALIAMLIDELGVRPAEVVVRGWVANFATSPLASASDVIAAIRAGRCAAGIVPVEPEAEPPDGLGLHLPEPARGNVRAIGVARHARNPAAARRFVDWYLDGVYTTLEAPGLAGRNIAVAGRLDEEAVLLAERAGYR